MSEQQPEPGSERRPETRSEAEGEYTDAEDAAHVRHQPAAEPAGSYVDRDETHVAEGREGQYADRDGESVPGREGEGHFTDTDR